MASVSLCLKLKQIRLQLLYIFRTEASKQPSIDIQNVHQEDERMRNSRELAAAAVGTLQWPVSTSDLQSCEATAPLQLQPHLLHRDGILMGDGVRISRVPRKAPRLVAGVAAAGGGEEPRGEDALTRMGRRRSGRHARARRCSLRASSQ